MYLKESIETNLQYHSRNYLKNECSRKNCLKTICVFLTEDCKICRSSKRFDCKNFFLIRLKF